MTELTLIALMDVYDQCGKLTNFVPDYLDKRDKHLRTYLGIREEEPITGEMITSKNLDAIIPNITSGLILKLSQRISNPSPN